MSKFLTSLLRIYRTTAFRLGLFYVFLFAVFSGSLVTILNWQLQQNLRNQLIALVSGEFSDLRNLYLEEGLVSLVNEINVRAQEGRALLYVLVSPHSQVLAGNMLDIDKTVFQGTGWTELRYQRLAGSVPSRGIRTAEAIVRVFSLDDQFRLIIGQDTGEIDRLSVGVQEVGRIAIVLTILLGILGGAVSARRLLSRIDRLTDNTQSIVDGNISSRLTISGSGDEIDRLAQSVNVMLDRIERLLNGMREISDNIAHELKSPLTRIQNRAERALSAIPENVEPHVIGNIAENAGENVGEQALQSIIRESSQLIRTFDALLLIARIEAGSTGSELTRQAVVPIIENVIELFEPLAEEAGLVLLSKINPKLKMYTHPVHRDLFTQALANLIVNAIRYSLPHDQLMQQRAGTIIVSMNGDESGVNVCVADCGPGIPPDKLSAVTKRFSRLERDIGISGSGLGLSLVTAIAHFHGGTLKLQNTQPGLIATITLGIPR